MTLHSHLNLIIITLIFASMSAQAQDTDSSYLAEAPRRIISLDEDMSDWEGLNEYSVALSNKAEPTLVTSPGTFAIAWDDLNLYIKGSFTQDPESLMVGLDSDAEEWWLADTFEVFLRPLPDADILHFAASPDGTSYTNFLSSNDFETFSMITETGWTLQIALPLGTATLPTANTGNAWDIKVARGHVALNEYSIWPAGGDFLAEDNFGLLYFQEAE